MEGFLIRGWDLVFPGCSRTGARRESQLSLRAPPPPHCPRSVEGAPWTNGIGARKMLG